MAARLRAVLDAARRDEVAVGLIDRVVGMVLRGPHERRCND